MVGSESSDTVERPPGDDCSGKGVLAGGGGGVGAGPTLLLWGRPPSARADPIGDGLIPIELLPPILTVEDLICGSRLSFKEAVEAVVEWDLTVPFKEWPSIPCG